MKYAIGDKVRLMRDESGNPTRDTPAGEVKETISGAGVVDDSYVVSFLNTDAVASERNLSPAWVTHGRSPHPAA